MLTDPRPFRYLGLDLSSRSRRRAAVVLTYFIAAFLWMEALCRPEPRFAVQHSILTTLALLASVPGVLRFSIFSFNVEQFLPALHSPDTNDASRSMEMRFLDEWAVRQALQGTYPLGERLLLRASSTPSKPLQLRSLVLALKAANASRYWIFILCVSQVSIFLNSRNPHSNWAIALYFCAFYFLLLSSPSAYVLWHEPRMVGSDHPSSAEGSAAEAAS